MMTGVHDINTYPFGARQMKVHDKEKVETYTGSICAALWSRDRWQIYSSTWRRRNVKEDAFGGPDLHNRTPTQICYSRHCSQGQLCKMGMCTSFVQAIYILHILISQRVEKIVLENRSVFSFFVRKQGKNSSFVLKPESSFWKLQYSIYLYKVD